MLKKFFIFVLAFVTIFLAADLAKASGITITNISTNINAESNLINFSWLINNAGLGINVGLGAESKTVTGKVSYGLSSSNLSETKSYSTQYPSVTLSLTPSIAMIDGQTYYYQITATDGSELVLSDILSFVYHDSVTDPFSLITPVAGETYKTGDKVNVSWTTKIAADKISAIFIEGIDSYGYVLNSVTPPVNSTSYSWSIPKDANGLVKLKLRASYYDLNNFSKQIQVTSPEFKVTQDAVIKIQSPQAGTSIKLGDNIQVKYTYDNALSTNFQPVFSLYKGGKLLLSNIYISGTDNFWANDSKITTGNDYQIKVTVGSNEAFSPNFSITVPESIKVTVTTPKKSDILKVGSSHEINWSSECKGGIASVWFSTLPDKNGDTLLFPLTNFSNSFSFSGQNSSHEFFSAFQFNSLETANSGKINWVVPSFLNITHTSLNTGQKAAYYIIGKADGKFLVVEEVINPTIIKTSETDYVIRVYVKGNNCMASGVSEPFRVTLTGNSVTTAPVKTESTVKNETNNTNNTNSNVNKSTASVVAVQLQRKISELEKQVIDLEKKATKLDQNFANKYTGTMFLDVENKGRLWYVDPVSKNRFYFENGESALSIGSKLATGITYENLQKIPVGIPESLHNLIDTDGDGLPDNLEVALGTDHNKYDTDGDGRSDKQELLNGYNPTGSQKYVYDKELINRLEGKMMLQVSGPNSHGEIWYIHKGKRWYGGTKDSMYEIMKSLSLGATADNIRKIGVGEVSGIE